MARLIVKHLSLLAIVIVACGATIQAQPVDQQSPSQLGQSKVPLVPLIAQGRSVYDQYTLGDQVDGAKIIYSYQHDQTYDDVQEEISLTFDYPSENAENTNTITQVTVYLEADDGATTQAYVTKNGIGDKAITLNMVAHNSKSLHYMIVVYGKEM